MRCTYIRTYILFSVLAGLRNEPVDTKGKKIDIHLYTVYIIFFKKQDSWRASLQPFLMKYLHWHLHNTKFTV